MLLRSSLSSATVRPRYSVSRTAVESSKFFVSSATVASFCAMATPCLYETHRGGGAPASAPASSGQREELRRKRTELGGSISCHLRGPLLSSASILALAHDDDRRSSVDRSLRDAWCPGKIPHADP